MQDQTTLKCPLCKGEMQLGFLPDMGHYQSANVPQWYPNSPTRGWFGGIKRPEGALKVQTFRCNACGYLMSFAT